MRPSELNKPLPDIHEDDPTTGEDERCLLIVHDVHCECGFTWTDSEIIFRSKGYSYHLTRQRYDALLNGSLIVEGKRVHSRLVPICHNCKGGNLPNGWTDSTNDADPHYPYEQWPDKWKNSPRRTRMKRPDPEPSEIRASIIAGLDEDD